MTDTGKRPDILREKKMEWQSFSQKGHLPILNIVTISIVHTAMILSFHFYSQSLYALVSRSIDLTIAETCILYILKSDSSLWMVA